MKLSLLIIAFIVASMSQWVWVLHHVTGHCLTPSWCSDNCDSGGCNDTMVHRKPPVDDGVSLNRAIQSGPLRGLEGPRANTKSRPHKLCRLCKGDLGVHPQEILRFYVLWSVFWGFPRLLFVHAYILRSHVFGTWGCSKSGMGARYVNWMTWHVVSAHLWCECCWLNPS